MSNAAEANLPHQISEVPANGTDSSRGDYLPTVAPPAGMGPDDEAE
jgi:hypothetical protein